MCTNKRWVYLSVSLSSLPPYLLANKFDPFKVAA